MGSAASCETNRDSAMSGDGPPQGMADRDSAALAAMLMSAIQHCVAGRLSEAQADCDRILRPDADQPAALNLSGMLATQQGRFERAVDLLTRAVRANPAFALAHFNLGVALQHLGRQDPAVDAYRQARTLNPT